MKRGTLFEKAVADVIRGFGDVTDVVQGEWRDGPDGRRDRDVTFTVNRPQGPLRALIECKDYDRRKTGRVGIGVIDAFDSKRRDLGVDIAIICSNAGFARPAIRKAQRVGIRTIGALRMGDTRIRFEVRDLFYMRRVTVEELAPSLTFPPGCDPSALTLDDFVFQGAQLKNWASQRAWAFICLNPIVNGEFRVRGRFKEPVTFTTPRGSVAIRQADLQLRLSGAWYQQEVALDASSGLYDWVRRRVQRVSGGSGQFQVRDLDPVGGGKWIERPPEHFFSAKLLYGEVVMSAALIWGPRSTGSVPMLDDFLEREDMKFQIEGPLPDEAITSKRGYQHPSGPPTGRMTGGLP